MKTLSALSVVAMICLSAVAVPAQEMPKFPPDSYMAKIQQRGTFNPGVKAELLGVAYQNPMTGKFEGFAVDLSASLAERIFGAPGHVSYKATLPVTRITMLNQGLIDAIVDTMFILPERWQQLDYAEPYWSAATRIFVKSSNTHIKQLKDLEGRRVSGVKGSTSDRWFNDPTSGYPKVQLSLFDSVAQSIEAVRVGRVEAAVFDEVFGLAAMKASSEFKLVGDATHYDYYGIGLAKGHPEFVEFISQWQRDIKTSGKWAELYRKNLPGDVPEPPMPPYDKAYYK